MTELPNGWVLTTVAEIAATSLGKMLDAKQATGKNPTPYLRNINVRWGRFDLSDVASMDIRPEELDRVLAQPGDVVACEGGEPGRAAVWRGPGAVALQKALHRVRPSEAVAADYVALLLRNQAVSGALADRFTGTTIKHLPQEKLRIVEVPLAPRAEQDRIVAAIEEAFSKLDAGEAGLRTVRQRLQRMRDALFATAVTGHLVNQDATDPPVSELLADLGAEAIHDDLLPPLPEGWAYAQLRLIADVVGGVTKDSKRQSDPALIEVPYLRVANVQRGYLDLAEVATIRVTSEKAGRLRLLEGDVLFNEGGDRDKLGRGWIWENQVADCIHQNHVFRARLRDQRLQPKLVSWWGNSFGKKWFEARGKQTTNLASLNLTTLKSFPVALAPPEEQRRISDEVERNLSFIEACERAVDAGLARSSALRRSVLKAAFEGKLVPQDPSDEPASMLLERIRAERGESAPVRSRSPRKVAR